MDFTAIDFETATGARDSACSVAVVAVQSDKLVRSYYTRIRPPFNKYNPFNISIHGIHEEDTENERDFAGIWESLAKELEGRIVLAHNAPFDMGVLRACIHRYDLKWPRFSLRRGGIVRYCLKRLFSPKRIGNGIKLFLRCLSGIK